MKTIIQEIHNSTPTPSTQLEERISATLNAEYEPAPKRRFFLLPTLVAGVGLAVALIALPQIDLRQSVQVSVDTGHVKTVPLVAQALDTYAQQLQNNVLYLHVEYRNGKDIDRWTQLKGTTRKDGNAETDSYVWISVPQETRVQVRNILNKTGEKPEYHYVNIQSNVLSKTDHHIASLPLDTVLSPEALRVIADQEIETIDKNKRACEWCLYGNDFQTELEELAASENAVEIETDSDEEIGYSIVLWPDDESVHKKYYFDAESGQLLRVHFFQEIDGEELETQIITFVEQQWLPYDEYKSAIKKITR